MLKDFRSQPTIHNETLLKINGSESASTIERLYIIFKALGFILRVGGGESNRLQQSSPQQPTCILMNY